MAGLPPLCGSTRPVHLLSLVRSMTVVHQHNERVQHTVDGHRQAREDDLQSFVMELESPWTRGKRVTWRVSEPHITTPSHKKGRKSLLNADNGILNKTAYEQHKPQARSRSVSTECRKVQFPTFLQSFFGKK